MGKTPRQEKAYDRNCREPHHFWGVEMGEMEFVFGFWGTKTVSRVLWFYFPMAVGLRLTPFPSETLRYGLQAKLPSEHLEKTEIRAETFCLALQPRFFKCLWVLSVPPTVSRDIFYPVLETSQASSTGSGNCAPCDKSGLS